MIHTARQLKALVRNQSGGNSAQAQVIIRNYVMERFLERISLSRYKNNFILKGGMLISAMVGIDNRSTMDIDTTIRNIPLTIDQAEYIINEIINVPLEDGITFILQNMSEIMSEDEYTGVRVHMEAMLESMKTPLKIDISTGDVITPSEITYKYKLMFENREIAILAYNMETVLAEKLQTVLSRGTANTRLRDFYDIYILQEKISSVDTDKFIAAFRATCQRRNSGAVIANSSKIIDSISDNKNLITLWQIYQKKFSYAAGISWEMVMNAIRVLYDKTQ